MRNTDRFIKAVFRGFFITACDLQYNRTTSSVLPADECIPVENSTMKLISFFLIDSAELRRHATKHWNFYIKWRIKLELRDLQLASRNDSLIRIKTKLISIRSLLSAPYSFTLETGSKLFIITLYDTIRIYDLPLCKQGVFWLFCCVSNEYSIWYLILDICQQLLNTFLYYAINVQHCKLHTAWYSQRFMRLT